METTKLLFLINGTPGSAAAVRAKQLDKHFSKCLSVDFSYRPHPKWKGLATFLKAAFRFAPDVIYVMDTAYAGVLAGYIAKKRLSCKLILDTGDVAYELAKSKGTYSKAQLQLIKWVEQLAMLTADCVIVRGSHHKTLLEQQGVPSVAYVPDGVEIDSVTVVDATPIKQKLNLDKYLTVGLVGTMNWSERHRMCYGWDVVEALAFLKEVPVKALLVGDGNGRAILEQRAEELGVCDRIIFTGQVPYDDLPQYLSAMDVCVSTQSNDLVGMVRTTGKLPLYLAYGKYVVATDVGEASRVLPGVGALLPYEGVRDNHHPARLAAHLRTLLANPQALHVAKVAKKVAKENFDYALLAKRLEEIL